MNFNALCKALCVTSMVASFLGCEPPEIEPLEPLPSQKDDAQPSSSETTTTLEAQAWWNELELPFEAWYVQYANGRRIGCYQTRILKPEVTKGIKIESQGLYTLRTSAQSSGTTPFKFVLESQEDSEGQILSFREESVTGETTTEISGKLLQEKLTITTKSPDGTKRRNLSWQEGTWGVLGIQSMLLAQPMKPGSRRECRIFVPKLSEIVSVVLQAEDPEITSLPGGATPELIPIEVVMQSSSGLARSRNWITDQGLIQKTVSLNPVISTFYAPKDIAQRVRDEMLMNRMLSKTVPFSGPPPATDDRYAVYIVEGSGVDLFSLFDKDVRQKVVSLTALTTQVSVYDVMDTQLMRGFSQEPPGEACLAATALIQSEHPTIGDLAQKLLDDERLPDSASQTELALSISERLSQVIADSDPTPTLQSALETARLMEADDKSKAILLAGLLRNRGIPARLATGLKIEPTGEACQFHLWTEAWCDQRWLPIDPATGQVAGLDCIKISDTTMQEANPYPPILQVYQVMDAIKIRRKNGD